MGLLKEKRIDWKAVAVATGIVAAIASMAGAATLWAYRWAVALERIANALEATK